MPKIGKSQLRAVGMTCGIGSMLVGARQAGFDVVGNVEWRKYYHYRDPQGRNTFEMNFPGAIFPNYLDDLTPGQLASITGCDILLGHPECGNFSGLGGSNKDRLRRMADPCDIPLFVDAVARLKPRFFVMDDLPKSFGAFSIDEYVSRLPEYDLFPEWVSNWGYGNIQPRRDRMFMIGSLKKERWVFIPGEEDHSTTVRDVIGDLPDPNSGEDTDGVMNQEPHEEDSSSGRFINMPCYGDRPTWREFAEYIREFPEGRNFPYQTADGGEKVRIGSCKIRWEGGSAVLHGGNPILHPIRCLPLTIRERARIQGFPDDFVFYGTKLDPEGRWNHEKNLHMVKQTGKAMPIQFCRYVSSQIRAFILGEEFQTSRHRILRPNRFVDGAKMKYCQEVGYSDQEGACGACWMQDRCRIRVEKYGIGRGEVQENLVLTGATSSRGAGETMRRNPRNESKTEGRNTSAVTQEGSSCSAGRRLRKSSEPLRIEPIDVVKIQSAEVPVKVQVERVEISKKISGDYHCSCRFCSIMIGELIRRDGSNYSRLERRTYYDPSESGEGGHIAKTPLHVARWAVQEYSSVGDWVLDPTVGAGTTIVESLIQGRNALGVELEFSSVTIKNAERFCTPKSRAIVGKGDARAIGGMLKDLDLGISLIQNNPPYFGDQSFPSPAKEGTGPEFRHLETTFKYSKDLPNLALLKEGDEYWDTMRGIYSSCLEHLREGGHFVVAVKDQMRSRKPDQLHEKFGNVLEDLGMEFVGTAILRHYPTTLHLNTYYKRYGIHPPYFQSILVFRKGGTR